MKWGGKGKQEEKGKQEKKDKQEKKERGKKGTLLDRKSTRLNSSH